MALPPNAMAKNRQERLAIKRILLTEEIAVDIINGVSKSDILTKLVGGLYEHQENTLSRQRAYYWYNLAVERIGTDSEDRLEVKRQVLWSRYEMLYNDCVQSGNIITAKGVLDSMAKVFGLQAPEQKELTLKDAIINFGFETAEE